jgi:hypothetical protein
MVKLSVLSTLALMPRGAVRTGLSSPVNHSLPNGIIATARDPVGCTFQVSVSSSLKACYVKCRRDAHIVCNGKMA